jgi:FMN phosphatase YigB (HAD superfamily)
VTAPLAVAAITIDFGNTLVRVDRPGLADVVERTADALIAEGIVIDRSAFLGAWVEERERQFREDVPEFREPDILLRAARVLARLRGMPPPPADVRWDDTEAATHVAREELDAIVDAYSGSFVARMQPVPDASETLARLSGAGFAVAILSNWPLASTIDRFAEAHRWLPHLRAIVVSQRVGTIKPHPSIFRAAEVELGIAGPAAAHTAGGQAHGMGVIGDARPIPILHVGDDWAADVVGAVRAGWRAAYLRNRQADTPLPTSEPGDGMAADVGVEPDLVIDELGDLPDAVSLDRDAAASLLLPAGARAGSRTPGTLPTAR